MAAHSFKSEAELAAVFVTWLRQEGWDVFEEVCFGQSAADIVATRNRIVWVIETKRSLTFAVLEQARFWRPYAHYVSVGVPHAKDSDGRALAFDTAAWLGVGVLEARAGDRYSMDYVAPDRWVSTCDGFSLKEHPAPLNRFCRDRVGELRAHLVPQQQNGATPAGNAEAKRSTVYSRTASTVSAHVARHPDGISPYDLVKDLGKLHYTKAAVARATLLTRAQQGLVPGVTARRDGGKWRLYPEARSA